MADIRKTFNFRDGVQVDDEVLVVRGNRVGLGTTSPDQLLDVRGNANITGVTSTVNFNVTGVGTFNQVKVGSNIILDATSGVMTATTFKGDGSSLSNIPTSQWVDVNLGAGVTSIYNDGSVGVGTTNPANPFQVGGDPNNGIGVGFSTSGNIKASGIVTATTFSGTLVGNVTGNVTGNLTGNADTSTFAGVSGISTVAENLTGNPSISVTNVNASGVGTFPTLVTTDLNSVTLKGFNSLRAPHGTTTTIVVTVATKVSGEHRYHGSGSPNGFVLDGVQAPYLTLTPGRTYRFDVSNGTNAGHPLRFYYDVDKTTPYTTGVTASGNAGVSGSYVDLVVSDTTPSVLHYQCSTHAKMGNSVQTGSNILDTEHDSEVRGTLTATTFSGNLTGTAVTSTTFFGNVTGTAITATTFTGALVGGVTGNVQGNVTGNLTGNVTGLINSVGVSTITRLSTTNISATGVSTFTDIDLSGIADLTNVYTSGVGTITRGFITNLNVSGVSTFANSIVAQGNLDVDGLTTLDDVNVSSAATIARAVVSALNVSGVTTSTGGFVGALTGDATGLSGTPNIVVNGIKATGVTTVGVLTATSIGIGTDSANANLQIHNASGSSSIVIGKNSAVADNNLQLRYGGGASSYSTSESIDLINYGDGNLNSFITGTSNFNWFKGNANVLMSLTDSGNLGIGITNPTDRLNVQGNVNVSGILTVGGALNITGQLNVPLVNSTDVSANLVGNVNSTGISTFNFMNIKGSANSGIGIGTTASGKGITVGGDDPSQHAFIGIGASLGSVGIKTDRLSSISGGGGYPALEVRGDIKHHGGTLKVGGQPNHTSSITPRAAIDFSDVVTSTDAATSLSGLAYMIFPRLTTTQRDNLGDGTTGSSTLLSGSIIYNISVNRLELWTGGAWCGIATVV